MKYTKRILFASLLTVLASCKNEELVSNDNLQALNVKEQFLNDDIPDGISNLFVNKIKDETAGKGLVEANCTTEEVSFDKTDSDFFLINPNGSLLWPGNVVGARTIQDGAPTSVPIYGDARNDLEIGLTVISGTAASTSTVVKSPTPGTVRNQLNSILNNYYNSGASFPASFEVSIQRIHNTSDLQFALNAGYSGFGVDVAGQLGLNFSQQKTRYAVTLKQRFFTATVTPKAGLIGNNGWFNNSVVPSDLENYVTDYQNVTPENANPSAYIESVTYGRLFTLIYESSESARNVEAALQFAYKGGIGSITADAESKYKETLNTASVRVKQIGGNAQTGITAGLQAIAGNLDGVKSFLEKGANVSATNPGYPISYKVNYISNNRPFKVTSNVSYTQRNCDLISRRTIRFNPDAVQLNYYVYDHGTSGLEIGGWFKVQKHNKDLNEWYDIHSMDWGYGFEHVSLDFYKYSQWYPIRNQSAFIDFEVDEINGERFRIVSIFRECDSQCTVLPGQDGTAVNSYEYNSERKAWIGSGRSSTVNDKPINTDRRPYSEFWNAANDGYSHNNYTSPVTIWYRLYLLD
ncbi:thiol-activated cytolysin family protein [Tenacibaculum amylolyticum]|uniref:thiol-activated cytolysin family protein n=1 Tax=Tenacibaculum amylolyticum TaxID=104269 RepID=UPI00389310A6